MDFLKFKSAVSQQFAKMSKGELFYTDLEPDALWITYIDSFPEGSNPKFRERTEHDCSCCKGFIRKAGNIVSVEDGKLVSIWDFKAAVGPEYQTVADALSKLVHASAIKNIFLHYEKVVGTDKNFEELTKDNQKVVKVNGKYPADTKTKTWDHFFFNLPTKAVEKNINIGPRESDATAVHDVFERSLKEISLDALDTVLELIAQNSIYRGEEQKFAVSEFRKILIEHDKLPSNRRDNYIWSKIKGTPVSVSKIFGTAVGKLLVALTKGEELEAAVGAYESMMDARNYKRTTALVTKKQVEQAKEKIAELGLTSALERRFATVSDLHIDNIIFANREARKVINDDVFDSIDTKTSKPKNLSKVEEVPIEKFISEIVPNAKSIEVLFENRHKNNLVSLVAPSDPTAEYLFKWKNNKFSWSYNGDVTDSIKERVKKAGGNVTGDLCCRLAWYNTDDLDFHMYEPKSGHISYCGKRSNLTKGELDVDMNVGCNLVRDPVENIVYKNRRDMLEGHYELKVHQFTKRENQDLGFEVEIDYLGETYSFGYDKAVAGYVTVANFKYTHKGGFEIISSLPHTTKTQTIWGIKTNEYQKVNVLTLSPNYWDGAGVGNKHYFFMLQDCRNDGQSRGFYNEFLREELTPHRKVLEMVGSKLKTAESVDQLSGLGFSSTQKNDLLVKVSGSFTRTIKVVF